MPDPAYAFVHVKPLTTAAEVSGLARHGRGIGKKADERRRPNATHRCLAWSYGSSAKDALVPMTVAAAKRSRVMHVPAAMERYLRDENARVRKGAKQCLKLIAGLSPSYRPPGQPELRFNHDPENPLNQRLLVEARNWANKELGGCVHARMDLDERGMGVVDLFVVPVSTHARWGTKWVSANKALQALALRQGRHKVDNYAALQDSFCQHMARAFDDRSIQRGRPKAETGAEHLSEDDYARMREEAKARGIAEAQEALEREREEIAEGYAEQFKRARKTLEAKYRKAREAMTEYGRQLEEKHNAAMRQLDKLKQQLMRREEALNDARESVSEDLSTLAYRIRQHRQIRPEEAQPVAERIEAKGKQIMPTAERKARQQQRAAKQPRLRRRRGQKSRVKQQPPPRLVPRQPVLRR